MQLAKYIHNKFYVTITCSFLGLGDVLGSDTMMKAKNHGRTGPLPISFPTSN